MIMKELSVEEKAKAYDEALEKARQLCAYPTTKPFISDLQDLFSELKESEDERIRDEIISAIKEDWPGHTDWIAWLEKQGEHKKFINGIQVGDKVTRNEDGVLVNLSQLNRVAKKQGEQKPADKSDLVLNILNKENQQVQQEDLIMKPSLKILGENELILNEVISILDTGVMPSSLERARLVKGLQSINLQLNSDWSKEDEVKDNWEFVHEFVNKFGRIPKDEDELSVLVEYVLKRQKSTEWSEEDEKILNLIIAIFEVNHPNEYFKANELNDPNMRTVYTEEIVTWLKSIKEKVLPQPKQEWTEEDELHIRELEGLVRQVWATAEHENDKDTIHKMSDLSFFLKTLKPQLKQEWSEEDERNLNDAILFIETGTYSLDKDNLINWLKSLRPQLQWKPSDKQIEALESVTENCAYSEYQDCLKELIEQLKKLKGE